MRAELSEERIGCSQHKRDLRVSEARLARRAATCAQRTRRSVGCGSRQRSLSHRLRCAPDAAGPLGEALRRCATIDADWREARAAQAQRQTASPASAEDDRRGVRRVGARRAQRCRQRAYAAPSRLPSSAADERRRADAGEPTRSSQIRGREDAHKLTHSSIALCDRAETSDPLCPSANLSPISCSALCRASAVSFSASPLDDVYGPAAQSAQGARQPRAIRQA